MPLSREGACVRPPGVESPLPSTPSCGAPAIEPHRPSQRNALPMPDPPAAEPAMGLRAHAGARLCDVKCPLAGVARSGGVGLDGGERAPLQPSRAFFMSLGIECLLLVAASRFNQRLFSSWLSFCCAPPLSSPQFVLQERLKRGLTWQYQRCSVR